MERAFNEVFARTLGRTLKEAVSDPQVKEHFLRTIKDFVKSGSISPELIEKNIDEVAISCLGALSADIAVRSMYEGKDGPLEEAKRLVCEGLIKSAGDLAFSHLAKGCNMGQAISQFGEEKLEEIVERISTQDIYLRPEFDESLVSLKQILSNALEGN
jgi:hypothetical protein